MSVRGTLLDMMGTLKLTKTRRKQVEQSSDAPIEEDYVTSLARKLHPGPCRATLLSSKHETSDTVRLRFRLDERGIFKPGTYLSIEVKIGGKRYSRPYSIASSPALLQQEGIVEIFVKKVEGGIVSTYLCQDIAIGERVRIEVGCGGFHYEMFRDEKHLICLAGGVGVAPFLSMAKSLQEPSLKGVSLTLFYGARTHDDLLALNELNALISEWFHVVYVLSEEPSFHGEKGFITKEIIRKYVQNASVSYFICGPTAMKEHLFKELSSMGVDTRKVQVEAASRQDSLVPDELHGKNVKLTVIQGVQKREFEVACDQSLAASLEQLGYRVHTNCRQGRCGVCRVQLCEGECFFPAQDDGRRAADKQTGALHACHAYPLTDIVLQIPIR